MAKKSYELQLGDVEKLLGAYGIEYAAGDQELRLHCIFAGCDDDSAENEHHLYINRVTGLYYCHKCRSKGNYTTLKAHLRRNYAKRKSSASHI